MALAAAKAAEVLGRKPEKIEVYLSANILKNAMGVGIPGTGMVGLPIAIALGSIIGKSAYGLEVLKDLTPEGLKEGKNPWSAPQKINGQWVIYNPQMGNKVLVLRAASGDRHRRSQRPLFRN